MFYYISSDLLFISFYVQIQTWMQSVDHILIHRHNPVGHMSQGVKPFFSLIQTFKC